MKNNLKQRYNITIEEYDMMMKAQDGKCKICNGTCKQSNRLCVDHCHATGKIRGLLCHSCNMALGKFKENIDILESAIKYLKEARDGIQLNT